MGSDYLAEITENEATGEVADLYDELRGLLGASKVNLFYRHLATVQPALTLAVQGLRELVSIGLVPVDTDTVLSAQMLPRPAQVPPRQAWTSLGLSSDDLAAAAGLLATYNRLNLNNLAVVIGLRRFGSSPGEPTPPLHRQRRPGTDAGRPAGAPASAPTAPVTQLSASDLALIEELKRRYGLPRVVVPSLLRDLGTIPPLLPALAVALCTSLAPGAVLQAAAGVRERIASHVDADAAGSPAAGYANPELARTARTFAPTMSTMYVLGSWLEDILGHEDLAP